MQFRDFYGGHMGFKLGLILIFTFSVTADPTLHLFGEKFDWETFLLYVLLII